MVGIPGISRVSGIWAYTGLVLRRNEEVKPQACPVCQKQVPSAGHTTMICPVRQSKAIAAGTESVSLNSGSVVRQSAQARQIVRQVKMRDFLRSPAKELKSLPFELLRDGEVIARLEKP